ncbi:TetR/AcrR family transcriptional regulator [Rhodococcus sp. ABRD24]|uniref:TetR/AcrR family transcriptional regulator n=1 Tax=Rhodococcus sp. ABRD24 TaxID=2507582 RepID=UPI00103966EE|nr:helix-turn-helix domain-containing protein [Rhodococcus sp. ABRD24]QBJ98141.1 TetR/AcrR family transcriptional regulator [Rhodococcus sp. ABRD24]
MARLTRLQQRELNRRRVLTAARAEFSERGFRRATVDDIAIRADLTRGAVYSNFPGKRALYLAVLAEEAENASEVLHTHADTPAGALGVFAGTWVDRLPRTSDYEYQGSVQLTSPVLGLDLIPEILTEEQFQRPFAQLLKLDAILLGLALERMQQHRPCAAERMVAVAESVLTILYGASQLSFVAPDFVNPATVVATCRHAIGIEIEDRWTPPHIDDVTTEETDEEWTFPRATDVVRGKTATIGDGILALVGMNRLEHIEHLVRAVPTDTPVTAVIVTADPAELAPLARLALSDLCRSLRQAFPSHTWPQIQLVVDANGEIAAASGADTVDDDTELAVAIHEGRIVSRSRGRGACLRVDALGSARN